MIDSILSTIEELSNIKLQNSPVGNEILQRAISDLSKVCKIYSLNCKQEIAISENDGVLGLNGALGIGSIIFRKKTNSINFTGYTNYDNDIKYLCFEINETNDKKNRILPKNYRIYWWTS